MKRNISEIFLDVVDSSPVIKLMIKRLTAVEQESMMVYFQMVDAGRKGDAVMAIAGLPNGSRENVMQVVLLAHNEINKRVLNQVLGDR